MEYILGVDGGGTKTIALVANLQGNILGKGLYIGSNYHSIGLENALNSIKLASEKAFSQAKISQNNIKVACLGLAGAGRKSDYDILFPAIENLSIAHKILLKHDAFIAFAGATLCRPGVIVIAGTGTMAFGINSSGNEERSSGWGNILGDEGSAYYIGRKALSSACKAFDGRAQSTSLLKSIMNHFQIQDFNDIIKKVYDENISPKDIAIIATIVSQQAKLGDEIAINILKEASFELALSVNSVIRKLDMQNEKVLVAIAGSVFNSGELLLGSFSNYIKSAFPLAEIINPIFNPVKGALLLALRESGIDINNNIINNITEGDYLIENN